MPLIIDPAKAELKALRNAAPWRGARILEIGCGDGRLTLRLASLGPDRIEALDPDPARIRLARRKLPSRFQKLIRYHVGSAQRLGYPDNAFNIVVLSWSL